MKKMHCTSCNNKDPFEMKPIERYHFTESGLNNVYLVGGGVSKGVCPKCGEDFVSIKKPRQLGKAIKNIILKKEATLTGDEIRYLRKQVGHSQEVFADILGISRETLNRYENASVEMNPTVERLIRFIVAESDTDQRYFLHDAMKTHDLFKLKKNFELCSKDDDDWKLSA